MNNTIEFKIDVDAEFPHLPHAPIVEAVIHWQASPGNILEPKNLQSELERRFPEYSTRTQHGIEAAVSGFPDGMEFRQRTQWEGFRLASTDEKHICQVKPSAILFSRLAPYQGWPTFVDEAYRFWNAYVDLASPFAVQRIRVRFISQIRLNIGEQASDHLRNVPEPLESIELASDSFFHQDTLRIPGHAYQVNLVRAILAPEPSGPKSLIVDIGVTTTDSVKPNKNSVETRLREMRFLKNKIFFAYMKDAEAKFGEKQQ